MTVLTGPPQVRRLAPGGRRAGERDQLARIPLDLWQALAGDQEARARYYSKVYWRGPGQCAFFLGALSSGGHGRFRAGTRRTVADRPASLVVPAHVYGYVLSRGGRMRAKHAALVEALTGMFDDHHGEVAQILLDQIAFCDAKIARLGMLISEQLASIQSAWGISADGTTGPHAGAGPGAPVAPATARLDAIPGISLELAASIIAETGLDMTRFPTPGHLVSWAGLCPRTLQSGPRTRHGKGHGSTYLRGYLGQAATGAASTHTFLGERYRRIARRRGGAKAQVAVARSILIIIWHLLADPAARFTDLGPDWHHSKTDKNRQARNHIRQRQALGYQVTITQAA